MKVSGPACAGSSTPSRVTPRQRSCVIGRAYNKYGSEAVGSSSTGWSDKKFHFCKRTRALQTAYLNSFPNARRIPNGMYRWRSLETNLVKVVNPVRLWSWQIHRVHWVHGVKRMVEDNAKPGRSCPFSPRTLPRTICQLP
jgi:hypothetical protein